MDWYNEILSNKLIVNGFIAWLCSQVLKTITNAVINRKFDIFRLVGDGGMPSSHSATVSAVATTSAMLYGFASFEFGVTLVLAFIVMHDAMGVRQETGKHSKILNELIEMFHTMEQKITSTEKLEEFVGHTPMQVSAGALLGVLVALLLG